MPLIYKNLQEVLFAIERIENNQVEATGAWDVVQHLVHCGQSVQFSMDGYPLNKHWLLQETIGKIAFNIFRRRGFVKHDTNKLTPGSLPTEKNKITDGTRFLIAQIERFDSWDGPMKTHEFYGKLTKKEFALTHAMHIANHFESFKFLD